MAEPVDLGGTVPAWPPAAVGRFEDCLARSARRGELWRVPAPQGEDLLRERIGAWFGLDPATVTVTSGVRSAALTYGREALRRSSGVLVERPTFSGAPHVLKGFGADVEAADWERLLTGDVPGESVLWLTSPFRNPDGATLGPADGAALEKRAATGHTVVVNAAYAWCGDRWPVVAGADVLGSFHKIAGHGVRLGWVQSATYFERAVPELLGTTPSRVWQLAWAEFMATDEFTELVRGSARASHDAGTAFADRLRDRFGRAVAASPHVLLPLAPGSTEEDAVADFKALGYSVGPGSAFGAEAPSVRASFLGASTAQAEAFADLVGGSALLAASDGTR